MLTKICKTCKIEKDIKLFPYHDSRIGTHRAHCEECYSNKRKQWRLDDLDNKTRQNRESYQRHKNKIIPKVIAYQKANPDKRNVWQKTFRLKTEQEWRDFKDTLECSDCGENDGACLDFHHLDPDEKRDTVSRLKFFKVKVKEEIKKCIVLCANCHRKLHAREKENINQL